MMLTEDDALGKWCPHIRAAVYHPEADEGEGPAASNAIWQRLEEPDRDMFTCIGSRCMAWRWDPGKLTGGYDADGMAQREPPTHGYCGLAGKP